ncbi:YncE family protein [Rhodococcus sp. ACPA1]|uniref:YncE family protein n=1 Tax=Rhodococcus sp. ACPA1 TaxID=2028572 RepID=UPI00211BA0D2|nr:hypothetical protein [Rhodococcus sp. ACPA1]
MTSQPLGYVTDLAVSEDGRHLYGTSGASVTVIDTESMTGTAEVTVGPVWDLTRSSSEFTDVTSSVAVNADGTRAYATYHVSTVERASGGGTGSFITDNTGRLWRVTGGYEVVAVIDVDPSSTTYGTQLATVRLPEGAQDVAISADGDLLYVSGADGRTVSVVDAATYAVLGTFVTDPDGSTSRSYGPYRFLLVDPDPDTGGTLYVTDYADAPGMPSPAHRAAHPPLCSPDRTDTLDDANGPRSLAERGSTRRTRPAVVETESVVVQRNRSTSALAEAFRAVLVVLGRHGVRHGARLLGRRIDHRMQYRTFW